MPLRIIEAMLMFQPDQINLWHEAGLLYARMDRIVDAIRALEEFLGRTQTGKKSHKVAMLLQELRTRLN